MDLTLRALPARTSSRTLEVVAHDGAEALDYLFGAGAGYAGRAAARCRRLVLLDLKLPQARRPSRCCAASAPTSAPACCRWSCSPRPSRSEDVARSYADGAQQLRAQAGGLRGVRRGRAPTGHLLADVERPPLSAPQPMLKPLRVLLIEDSDPDALLLGRHLRQGGLEPAIRRVETAAQLQAALPEEEWHVIISDYRLPGFDGMEALQQVKAHGRDVPFILVSGVIGDEQAVAAMKAGAHDFILKDKLARLVPAIERELRDAETRRQRREAETALRLAKEEWERTFDSVPDLVAIIDGRHRIRRANRAMADRLGRSPEACVGLSCCALVHGTDSPPGPCPHAQTLTAGLSCAVEINAPRLGGDFMVTTTPLLDDQNQMIGSVHVARDITERKRAETALRQNQERLLLAQRAGRVGVFDVNLQTRTSVWTAERKALFGLPPDFRETADLCTPLIEPQDRNRVQAQLGDWRFLVTSRNTNTTPATLPSLSLMGAALSSMGIAVRAGDEASVVGHLDGGTLPQHPSDDVRARDAGGFVHDPEHALDRLTQRFLPRPTGQGLGDGIEERDAAGGVGGDQGVADALESDTQPLAFPLAVPRCGRARAAPGCHGPGAAPPRRACARSGRRPRRQWVRVLLRSGRSESSTGNPGPSGALKSQFGSGARTCWAPATSERTVGRAPAPPTARGSSRRPARREWQPSRQSGGCNRGRCRPGQRGGAFVHGFDRAGGRASRRP